LDDGKLVSVSVPTYNSGRTIYSCLKSIANQTYSPIEIIVVDSYSKDQTVSIAKKFGARIFFERGLTRQRFKCIEESRGQYIVLLDSDVVMSPTLVEQCVRKLNSYREFDALFVNNLSLRKVNGSMALTQSNYMESAQLDPDPVYGTALPRFFRADALKTIEKPRREIGYFDYAWIYFEFRKKGFKATYIDAVEYHMEYNHPIFIMKKFYRHYGHYIVPAFVENPMLVLWKSAPKRILFSTNTRLGVGGRINQLLLYGTKVVCTTIGIYHSMISKSAK
jgi:glycosyltransferase involved in cell wall biosynthesis